MPSLSTKPLTSPHDGATLNHRAWPGAWPSGLWEFVGLVHSPAPLFPLWKGH
jgi:hypothetical protein